MCPDLAWSHIVSMIISVDLSQEILATDVMTVLQSSLEHSSKMFCDRYDCIGTRLKQNYSVFVSFF